MGDFHPEWEQALRALARLHGEVDRRAARLAALHASRLVCRLGCRPCCVDDLTVFDIEAENVRRHHPALLLGGDPHPTGACAFLDAAGACRVYAHRPYVCRTQGLPLRWIEELPDGTPVEMRDICPLNDNGPPVEDLPDPECWTIGPMEARMARLQARLDGGRLLRVSLRSLFGSV